MNGVARTIPAEVRVRRRALPLAALLAAAVAIAFADSSIVVLALPQLYGELHTTIGGVAWVVTAYNAAVAVTALVLVVRVHRLRAQAVLRAGLLLFLGASIACSLANSLPFLVAARSVQGTGAALLLAGSLPMIASLTGSAARAAAVWTLAGTYGAALGPALGGALTQAFDWRAIFVAQAPVAAAGLVATFRAPQSPPLEEGWRRSLVRATPANLCLALIFGALVGALFLAVLLVITVWGYSPLAGAAIVSTLPLAAVCARPLERRLARLTAVCGGAALLALGLVALALLPSSSVALAASALALCGAGLGLAIPVLSAAAIGSGPGLTRRATFTIGVRHLGLVLALASIAPLLAAKLPAAGDEAKLKATAVLLDGQIGLGTKVPVAIDLAREFERAQDGEIPDLAKPFNDHGGRDESGVAEVRDRLIATIEGTITRAFRPAFLLSAAFAALALVAALVFRRRAVE